MLKEAKELFIWTTSTSQILKKDFPPLKAKSRLLKALPGTNKEWLPLKQLLRLNKLKNSKLKLRPGLLLLKLKNFEMMPCTVNS